MINMTEVASLIKILAVVPVGFVFSKFFYIIASNSPYKLISDKKVTAKGFYKDIRITNLFELYEDHSVIFKISDIKTISFNVDW